MRITLYLFLFLLHPLMPLLAQSGEMERLKKEISTQSEDSLKVNNLIALSTEYLGEDADAAIGYGSQAQQLAKKIGFPKGEAYAYKAIGLGYYYQANYPEAIERFQNSLALFDSIGFRPGSANMLSNLGSAYFNAGDNTKSIDSHLRALKIGEEINDSLRIGTALNGVGSVYNNETDTEDRALQYFLKALPIFRAMNYKAGEGIVAMNVGEIYKKKKLYDSAIYYFDESLEIYQGTIEAPFPLNQIGEIYADRGEFNDALLYQNRALGISRELNGKLEIAQSLLGIAATYRKMRDYKSAISFYRESEKIANEISAKPQLKEVYEGLARCYAFIKDYKNAYVYDTLFSSMKDTLYNVDNAKKMQQLQFNFDIEKKEGEIDLLTKDQALKTATIQRQKTLGYAAGVVGVLLVLGVIGIYNRYKYIRKTNKIIKSERDRSKELLLNILPEETAQELETKGFAKTRYYESVTVLFTDFKGFSTIAGKLSPQALVAELNDYFGMFDEIVGRFGLEKIKTIGDAYMCAGGIPVPNDTHPLNAVKVALAMQAYMQKQNVQRRLSGEPEWGLRIGIHTGPIVAGVVGKKKYAYDIWGDTVNVASRMESSGEAGMINISSTTFESIKHIYKCIPRGKISAKNIGEVEMYFVDAETIPVASS